jgi:hypothetical protein
LLVAARQVPISASAEGLDRNSLIAARVRAVSDAVWAPLDRDQRRMVKILAQGQVGSHALAVAIARQQENPPGSRRRVCADLRAVEFDPARTAWPRQGAQKLALPVRVDQPDQSHLAATPADLMKTGPV